MSQEPLSTTIQIRVTDSQAQKLSEAAAIAGIPLSEYLRRKLQEKNEIAEATELIREAVASLRTMHDIKSCVAETVLLSRMNTMPNYLEDTHTKLRILGIPPYALG